MKLHFDGAPDRFSAMHKLFAESNFVPGVRVLYEKPDPRRFRWSRLQAMAQRAIWKVRRAAA